MSISLNRYVNINSQVGGQNLLTTRDLLGRLFTGNNLLPPQSFIQFSNPADVGNYFGITSEEYSRAQFYFTWINKNFESPDQIQFARYVPQSVIVQNGTVVMGSPDISALTNTAGIVVGAKVVGTNIPVNAYVISITSATALVISANATAGASGESITFTNNGVAPQIYGFSLPNNQAPISFWAGITNGSVGINIGGTLVTLTGLNFETGPVTSYGGTTNTSVAGVINAALAASSGAQFINGIVTYVASSPTATGGYFQFIGGTPANVSIAVVQGGSGTTDISGLSISGQMLLGWYPGQTSYSNNIFSESIYSSNAIWANGSLNETTTSCLTTSAGQSNNFGSFLFLNNLDLQLASDIVPAALWNQSQNVEFLYTIPVLAGEVNNYTNQSSGLGLIAGCCLTLQQNLTITLTGTVTTSSPLITGLSSVSSLQLGMPISGANIPANTTIIAISNSSLTVTMSANATGTATNESIIFTQIQYPEQIPMMIEAATNYANANSVQSYMFQIFPGIVPSVTTDSAANSYDSLSVNYYGQTQAAGQQLSFYQRGLMQGPSTAPLDMTTYVNELWLKDALQIALMNLLVNLLQLPANTQGEALALLAIQSVINQALNNGTISVGKTLTASQISYIGGVTNDNNAWYQVQNSGYWVDCIISIIPDSSPPQYQAAYTLIYSKDDTIRYVVGTDILI